MKKTFLLLLLAGSFSDKAQMFDLSFDTLGYTHSNGFEGIINSMLIQPDGKIVSAYYDNYNVNTYDYLLVSRTLTNGLRDGSFGNLGSGSSVFIGPEAHSMDVAIQPDGKILVSGDAKYCQVVCGNHNLGVARFKSNGIVDSTFGLNGLVLANNIHNPPQIMASYANRINLLPSGKMIVTGNCELQGSPSGNFLYVARLNSNGTKDLTFANNGVFYTTQSYYYTHTGTEVDALGNIYIAGSAYVGNYFYDGFIMKLLPSGILDNSFGNSGVATWSYMPHHQPWPTCFKIRHDGKFVVGGYVSDSLANVFTGFLTVIDPNGTPSNLYPSGTKYLNIPNYVSSEIRGVTILPDDHMVYCGIIDSTNAWNTRAIVGRLNPDGTDDPTFTGTSALFKYELFSAFSTFQSGTFANCVLQQPDGKVLVGGSRNTAQQSSWQAFTMARLIPNVILTSSAENNVYPGDAVIFPNPATDHVGFGNLQIPQGAKIQITDVMGKKIYERELARENEQSIDITRLESGIYYWEIISDSGTQLKGKLMIAR